MPASDPIALVDHLFRRQAGQMVATLTRTLGPRHLALAEDAVQDALITAMQQWPFRGVPENPEAWLFQVARNRALDRLRHGKMAIEKEPDIARGSTVVESPGAAPLLRREVPPLEAKSGFFVFTCHPSLEADARARRIENIGGSASARSHGRFSPGVGIGEPGLGSTLARPVSFACRRRAIFPAARFGARFRVTCFTKVTPRHPATDEETGGREAIRLAHMIAMLRRVRPRACPV